MPGAHADPRVSPSFPVPADTTGALDPERVVQGLEDLQRGPEFLLLLIAIGEPAVGALARFLLGPPSPHPQPRMLAAEALGAIGGAKASRALAEALGRASPGAQSTVLALSEEAVRNCAARQLGYLGDAASVEPLLEALRRSHLIGAGEALVGFRETRAIPLLVECLGDAFSRERVAALLLEFGREAVGALVAALHTIELKEGAEPPRSVERRAACARLLGEIKDPRGEPVLGESLEDPAPEVRRSAAIALALVASEALIPERVRVLIGGLGDAALSDECAEALLATPEDALPRLAEAVSAEAAATSTRGIRGALRRLRSMVRVIARMGEPGTRALAQLACHDSALVRGLAVAHLGRTEAPIARSVIVAALRDPDARVRRTAAAGARRMGVDVRTSAVAGNGARGWRAWRTRLARLLERLGHA
jgi:HEAT repeat protein